MPGEVDRTEGLYPLMNELFSQGGVVTCSFVNYIRDDVKLILLLVILLIASLSDLEKIACSISFWPLN